jgi:4'-phosphopantetheinyl transferase
MKRAPFPTAQPPRRVAATEVLHLWWCETRAPDQALPELRSWLSDGERERATRFALPALEHRYTVGRAALRHVLGEVLGSAPADVAIVRGPRGRPRLASAGGVDFNVSNTLDVALIGIATQPGVRIGVDVEHRGRQLRHEALARKFCTPAEYAAFDALAGDARRERFLRLWTCKEAMGKATGDALGAPLRRLEVEVEPALRLAAGPSPYLPADWTLLDAAVPGDYVASVALWRAGASADFLTR